MKVKFISLASGSSGNCYYLGTETYGILIDAGIGIRTIKKTLKDYNILMDSIRAVFITHDHADHIKAVGNLGEKLNIPVYTTARIHAGINRSYCMTEKLSSSVRYLEKQEPMTLEDFHIESFEVPHDGTDNVGVRCRHFARIFRNHPHCLVNGSMGSLTDNETISIPAPFPKYRYQWDSFSYT